MEAIKVEHVLETDGEILVKGLPWRKGQRVELILSAASGSDNTDYPLSTGRHLAQSDLVGLWKDRTDITDSSAYARQLRERVSRPRYTRP